MQQRISPRLFTKRSWPAFGIGLIVLFVFSCCFHVNVNEYYYDSGSYFDLANNFFDGGRFDLFSFPQTFRGVSFPLLLSAVIQASRWTGASVAVAFRVFAAVWFSFVCTMVLPYIFEHISGRRAAMLPRLGVVAAMMLFWRGLLLYPLSDFYAISQVLCAIAACLKVKALCQTPSDLPRTSRWQPPVLAALAGLCAYTAYNTRTIYLFALIFIIPLIVYAAFKRGWKLVCLCVLTFLIGVCLAGVPQALLNNHHLGTLSLRVITQNDMYANGLFAFQIASGVKSQQFLTFSYECGAAVGCEYFYLADPVGMSMVEPLKRVLENGGSISFGLLVQYAFSYIGICFRHIVQLLNPVFGEIYISNPYKLKIHLTLINYAMMVCTVLGIKLCISRVKRQVMAECGETKRFWIYVKGFGARLLWLLPLLLPCLAIIPGVPEQRFFIPLYLIMYAFLAFCVDWKELAAYYRAHKLSVIVWTVIALIVFLALISEAWNLSTLPEGMPITMW